MKWIDIFSGSIGKKCIFHNKENDFNRISKQNSIEESFEFGQWDSERGKWIFLLKFKVNLIVIYLKDEFILRGDVQSKTNEMIWKYFSAC